MIATRNLSSKSDFHHPRITSTILTVGDDVCGGRMDEVGDIVMMQSSGDTTIQQRQSRGTHRIPVGHDGNAYPVVDSVVLTGKVLSIYVELVVLVSMNNFEVRIKHFISDP
jgi:hypothetical protein